MGTKKADIEIFPVRFDEERKPYFTRVDNEPETAAYLGLSSRGAFRRLRLSTPVIKWFMIHEELKVPSNHRHDALQLIADTPAEKCQEDFPATLEAIATKYPIENIDGTSIRTHTTRRLAAVLYNLHREIAAWSSPDLSDAEKQTQQAIWRPRFYAYIESKHKLKYSTDQRPLDEDFSKTPIPILGPRLEFQEIRGEEYNRCLIMLKSVGLLSALTKWTHAFKNRPSTYYDDIKAISETNKPHYMRDQSKLNTRDVVHKTIDPSGRKFRLIIGGGRDKTADDVLNSHYKEFESGLLPLNEHYEVSNPTTMKIATEWRDAVRMQLKFPRRHINFDTITFDIIDPVSNKTGTFYNSSSPEDNIELNIFKTILDEKQAKSIDLHCTLCPVDIDSNYEEEEYPFEHPGLPSNLADIFVIGDDHDIQFRKDAPEDETLESIQTTDTASAQPQSISALTVQAVVEGGVALRSSLPGKLSIPRFLFINRNEMLMFYDNWDAWIPEEFRKWQCNAVAKLGRFPRPDKDNVVAGASAESRAEILAVKKANEAMKLRQDLTAIDHDASTNPSEQNRLTRHYQIQAAFTGQNHQTGPFVDLCRTVLAAVFAEKHGERQLLDKCRIPMLMSRIHLLDSQTNAVVWLLLIVLGKIPIHSSVLPTAEVDAAASILDSSFLRTHGGILVDDMGLGKTITAAAFLSALFDMTGPLGPCPRTKWQPIIILCPSAPLLDQWYATLKNFPGITVLSSYGAREPQQQQGHGTWISNSGFREAPDMIEHWPVAYRYVFDSTDPRAGRVVILLTYNTFAERSTDTVETTNEDGSIIKECLSRWRGRIHGIILDEGHNLRHEETKRFKSVDGIRPEWLVFLTGTPIVNSVKDILGPLKLLWPLIKQDISNDDEMQAWEGQENNTATALWEKLERLQLNDKHRLLSLNPASVEKLLEPGNISQIQRFYPIADNLFTIRRSAASELQNSNGSVISLESIMPSSETKTLSLEYSAASAREYAHFHRAYARDYSDGIALLFKSKEEREILEEMRGHKLYILMALRGMTILTTSTLLARFEAIMKRTPKKLDTRAESIAYYREIGLGVQNFIAIVHRDGDPPINTAMERAMFMAYGSAKVTTLYWFLGQFAVPLKGSSEPGAPPDTRSKLLITDEFPASAWFIQLCCEVVGIECEMLHAELSGADRIKLISRFNSPKSSLRVLIILYSVDLMGVNLDAQCCNVLVWTAATNAAVEEQAVARTIRVSQKRKVRVWRMCAQNSHDQWREWKQQDKVILELAMKGLSDETRLLLLQLLNEANPVVKAIHEEPQAKEMLKGRKFVPLEESMNQFFPDVSDGEEEAPDIPVDPRPKRKQQAPDRYGYGQRQSPFVPHEYGDGEDVSADDDSDYEYVAAEDRPDDDMLDDAGAVDSLYQPKTIKDLRRRMLRLAPDAQEAIDQDSLQWYRYLAMDPDHVYTSEDLEDEDILHRAYSLLFQAKRGGEAERVRLTPHINYKHLSKEAKKAIAKKLKFEQRDVLKAGQLIRNPRARETIDLAVRGDKTWEKTGSKAGDNADGDNGATGDASGDTSGNETEDTLGAGEAAS